uniref:Retrotransposon gag domain-containing protein n=1 Tax=Nelumbo nucifera TaxID=4432 RepID=A0A822XLP7_NELNU|nr:TPA_asm: hypothetical protein HUJ06_022660 [Nelumbo nucifera]
MTHRIRVSSLSSAISASSSAMEIPRCKHRRRIPPHHGTTTHESYETEASRSESSYPYQHDVDDDDQDDQNTIYSQSDSVTGTPRNRFVPPEYDSESEFITESSAVDQSAASLNLSINSPNLKQATTSTTAYVNIAPLPIFRGTPEECPVTHLSRFAKVCRANNAWSIDMMMKIFPVTLDNEAALWYDLNIEPNPSLSWEEIKVAFTQAYRRTEFVDQFRSELMKLRQGDGESVQAYYLRMLWILRRWPDHGIPDGLLRGIFIDGLREDFQDWIVPQKPNSLSDAFRLALTWEQAQSIRAARNKKNVTLSKCGFCEGPHEEQTCDIRERMRELWIQSKEKRMRGGLSSPAESLPSNPATVKEFVRSVSAVTSDGVGQIGEGEDKEEGGLLGGKKKAQCQCWKHQCWKKLERNNSSIVARNSTAE